MPTRHSGACWDWIKLTIPLLFLKIFFYTAYNPAAFSKYQHQLVRLMIAELKTIYVRVFERHFAFHWIFPFLTTLISWSFTKISWKRRFTLVRFRIAFYL